MFKLKTQPKIPYREYIQSEAWLKNHKIWLKQSGYRCAMFPWLRCGNVKGKYHSYNVHHMHKTAYQRQGKERYGDDVVVLSPIAHWFIHRVLGGHIKASKQKQPFPNFQQRLANHWCRLPTLFKWLLIAFPGYKLVLLFI